MAFTPKQIRKQGRKKVINSFIMGTKGKQARRARRWFKNYTRCTAAMARRLDRPMPSRKMKPYQDLPDEVPVTGPLSAKVVFEKDEYFGKNYVVSAKLNLPDRSVDLRGMWSFELRDGATERFALLFAKAIEAGLVVGEMELCVDVFGEEYISFYELDGICRQNETPLQWFRYLEHEFARKGLFYGQ